MEKSYLHCAIDTTVTLHENIKDEERGAGRSLTIETTFQLEQDHVNISCHNRDWTIEIGVEQLLRIVAAIGGIRNAARMLDCAAFRAQFEPLKPE